MMKNDDVYSKETLTAYLLGSLPAAQTEQLDELSIVNEEFVALLDAAEMELVDAYVEGELSGERLEQFRAHYLSTPLRRERTRFAESFHTISRNEEVGTSTESYTESLERRTRPSSGLNSLLSNIRGSVWRWAPVAAVLLMMITGGLLLFENMRMRRQLIDKELASQSARESIVKREEELRQQLDHQRTLTQQAEHELAQLRGEHEQQQSKSPQSPKSKVSDQPSGALSIASFLLTPQLRGAGEMKTLSVPTHVTDVVMQLQLDPSAYKSYRVELLSQPDNRVVWRSETLRTSPENNRKLMVRFPASLLNPKTYLLRVTGASQTGSSETLGDYPFRVTK